MWKATIFGLLGGLVMGILPTKAAELKVGDKSPEFSLQGSDGKTYKLADYRDKQVVVLAWFPKAFTPGCTMECRMIAKEGDKLKQFDAAYFTVSVDKPEKNADFAKAVKADYPILSDPKGEVAEAYGVTGYVQRWASRWTFYIGRDGKILYIDKNIHPATSAEDIANRLQELGVAKKSTK
jgi:peroxiredoxin Q/BCP